MGSQCAGFSARLTPTRCPSTPKYRVDDPDGSSRLACGLHISWVLSELGSGKPVTVSRLGRLDLECGPDG